MPGPSAMIRENCQLVDAVYDGLMSSADKVKLDAIPPGGGVSLSTANTWTKSQNVAAVALVDGASIATDASLGNIFTVTLGGNRTLANPTNLVAGGTYIWIVNNGTGSHSLAYGNLFTWPGGAAPVLSTGAGAVDVISAVYDGVALRAVAQLAFS